MLLDLITPRESRTVENPSVPLNASNIMDFFGLDQLNSSSGIRVNEKAALGNPAFWRGVNLLSLTMAGLPLKVYRRLSTGGKQEDRRHPAWKLLYDVCSPGLLSCQAVQLTTAKAIITGNGYLWILRTNGGIPMEMIPLDSLQTIPIVTIDNRNGVQELKYLTRLPHEGQTRSFSIPEESVIHIKGLHLHETGLRGLSLTEVLSDSLGVGLAAQRYGGTFFANNAQPSVVIKVPYKFRDQEAVEEFRRRWMNIHGGLTRSHRPAILEGGGDIAPLTGNNEDAQLIQLREFEVRQVANMLHLPASKLQDNTRTAYNSLEQDNKSFLEESMRPWINTWEKETRRKLLTLPQQEANSHTVEAELEAYLRTDKKTEIELLIAQVNNGVLTLDQALNILNLPAAAEGGDQRRIPTTVTIMGQETNSEEDDSEEDDSEDDTLPMQAASSVRVLEIAAHMVEDQVQRTFRRIGHHARKQAGKGAMAFRTWVTTFEEKETSIFIDALTPAATALRLLASGSSDHNAESLVSRQMRELKSELLQLSATANGNLSALVDETMNLYEHADRAKQFSQAFAR